MDVFVLKKQVLREWRGNIHISRKRTFKATFTMEAAMVLGSVFMVFFILLRQIYVNHDRVTGAMILAESLENARMAWCDETDMVSIEDEGRKWGNPRLWLGEYHLEIEKQGRIIYGKASAGDWYQEMEMEKFCPSHFLRQLDLLISADESE